MGINYRGSGLSLGLVLLQIATWIYFEGLPLYIEGAPNSSPWSVTEGTISVQTYREKRDIITVRYERHTQWGHRIHATKRHVVTYGDAWYVTCSTIARSESHS